MMMHMQSETNGRPQPALQTATDPLKNQLIEGKANLVSAILTGESCYVQGEDTPLRYRLLTDTALRLAELNQVAAYFDLSDLAYQYDLTTWVRNSIRLLAIQLNLPLPTTEWWDRHSKEEPIVIFAQFLGDYTLPQISKPVLLSFDEADQLRRAPLAADFWRLLDRLQQPEFQGLTVVLWGKASWEVLVRNGRFPTNQFKQIIL
jgi:hypothetical protein